MKLNVVQQAVESYDSEDWDTELWITFNIHKDVGLQSTDDLWIHGDKKNPDKESY